MNKCDSVKWYKSFTIKINLKFTWFLFLFFSSENVCTEREEDIEDWDGSASQTTEIRGDSVFTTGGFNLNFESCVERPNKHVCKTM